MGLVKEKTSRVAARLAKSRDDMASNLCSYSTLKDEEIPIHLSDGRFVGTVSGDVFRKKLRKSRHMLHSPLGWASDEDILVFITQLGVDKFVIDEIEEGITYEATLDSFYKYGILIDRGYGQQRALPLRFWRKQGEGIPQQLEFSFAV
jgi:hypothetical protein